MKTNLEKYSVALPDPQIADNEAYWKGILESAGEEIKSPVRRGNSRRCADWCRHIDTGLAFCAADYTFHRFVGK